VQAIVLNPGDTVVNNLLKLTLLFINHFLKLGFSFAKYNHCFLHLAQQFEENHPYELYFMELHVLKLMDDI